VTPGHKGKEAQEMNEDETKEQSGERTHHGAEENHSRAFLQHATGTLGHQTGAKERGKATLSNPVIHCFEHATIGT
jgi:hypothetical protein